MLGFDKLKSMKKRHVLLLGEEHILGESLEKLLKSFSDIHLSGPKPLRDDISDHVAKIKPDVVLITDAGDQQNRVASIAAKILDRFPNIPVIHSSLSRNVVRIYSSHELPARSADLIDAIRSIPVKEIIDGEVTSPEN